MPRECSNDEDIQNRHTGDCYNDNKECSEEDHPESITDGAGQAKAAPQGCKSQQLQNKVAIAVCLKSKRSVNLPRICAQGSDTAGTLVSKSQELQAPIRVAGSHAADDAGYPPLNNPPQSDAPSNDYTQDILLGAKNTRSVGTLAFCNITEELVQQYGHRVFDSATFNTIWQHFLHATLWIRGESEQWSPATEDEIHLSMWRCCCCVRKVLGMTTQSLTIMQNPKLCELLLLDRRKSELPYKFGEHRHESSKSCKEGDTQNSKHKLTSLQLNMIIQNADDGEEEENQSMESRPTKQRRLTEDEQNKQPPPAHKQQHR
jgi:hypothetical protein